MDDRSRHLFALIYFPDGDIGKGGHFNAAGFVQYFHFEKIGVEFLQFFRAKISLFFGCGSIHNILLIWADKGVFLARVSLILQNCLPLRYNSPRKGESSKNGGSPSGIWTETRPWANLRMIAAGIGAEIVDGASPDLGFEIKTIAIGHAAESE